MALSISVVVLLVVLTVVFLRSGRLKFTHALVCMLLGFYLAGSSLAPDIQNGLSGAADVVSSVRP
ncbi:MULTISPECIES: hypothetical protein [Streptomyces]|uniref:Uncharacterized protein n=2 Tax=Streptomyces rimosus subsp. rimosus TaxID=132474 RepID=L8EUP2_STRR1|nr:MULTISPECIES: hypothetical protein [Streptomyces]KOG71284.1 membrane protein [Kitasatospora aureofaciens]MYT48609.1 hypothetical protein [Streptomyces sp. SID5471]KEF08885.1 hypothetical protein DF17_00730 [Streptomyces rimosus]KEF16679.1 hypothetical protein DF18_33905 [Streptomyces rimosus]KUJ27510.1 hypothetical protein ADK46_34785 [Streptomyces rimosus subsp. rimosus]